MEVNRLNDIKTHLGCIYTCALLTLRALMFTSLHQLPVCVTTEPTWLWLQLFCPQKDADIQTILQLGDNDSECRFSKWIRQNPTYHTIHLPCQVNDKTPIPKLPPKDESLVCESIQKVQKFVISNASV